MKAASDVHFGHCLNIEKYILFSILHPVTAQGSNISHRAEGPKDDVGRGLIQVAIWKIVCIISFITYFVLTYPRRFLYLNTMKT